MLTRSWFLDSIYNVKRKNEFIFTAVQRWLQLIRIHLHNNV